MLDVLKGLLAWGVEVVTFIKSNLEKEKLLKGTGEILELMTYWLLILQSSTNL